MSLIDDLPEMLTTAEVARVLRKSEASIRRMCARGELAAVKVGRSWLVHKEAIRALLAPIALAGGRMLPRVSEANGAPGEPAGERR